MGNPLHPPQIGFRPHTSLSTSLLTTPHTSHHHVGSFLKHCSEDDILVVEKGRDSLLVSYGGSFKMTTLHVKPVVNSLYDVVETPPCTGPYTSSSSSSNSSSSSYGAGATPAVTSESDFCPADTPPPLAPSDWPRSRWLPHTCIIPGTASSEQYSLVHTTLG